MEALGGPSGPAKMQVKKAHCFCDANTYHRKPLLDNRCWEGERQASRARDKVSRTDSVESKLPPAKGRSVTPTNTSAAVAPGGGLQYKYLVGLQVGNLNDLGIR
jgi:hypothetical protein